jgi:hypothetical protein
LAVLLALSYRARPRLIRETAATMARAVTFQSKTAADDLAASKG